MSVKITPGQRASQKCSLAPAVAPCLACGIDMKFKLKMAASVKIIKEATKILRPLHNDVENFFLFENEVEENLMRLFQKHRNNQNSIERVRNSVTEVGSIIAGEITILLKKLHRRLSSRKKAYNPWTVQVRRDLPVQIFAFLLHMVKKARSTYGVTHSESRLLDIIVYTEENRVVRDLSRLCDVNREAILEYFSKTFQGPRKGNARVVISAQKPFTLSYSRKGSYVVIDCYYKFTNEYGYIFES